MAPDPPRPTWETLALWALPAIEVLLALVSAILNAHIGQNLYALATAVPIFLVAAVSVVATLTRKSNSDRVIRGTYAALFTLIAGYAVLIVCLAINPLDPTWLWVVQIVWPVVFVVHCSIVIRIQKDRVKRPSMRAVFISGGVGLIGATTIGISAAGCGLALEALRDDHVVTAGALFLAAGWGVVLGIALLVGRRTVIGLVLLGIGPLIAGFAVGAWLDGRVDLGALEGALGIAMTGMTFALWFRKEFVFGLLLVVAGGLTVVLGIFLFISSILILSVAWLGLGIAAVATGLAFLLLEEDEEVFRTKNGARPWGYPRYILTIGWAALVSSVLGYFTRAFLEHGNTGAAFSIAGGLAGSSLVALALVTATGFYRRSWLRAARRWKLTDKEFETMVGAGVVTLTAATINEGASPSSAKKWWVGEVSRIAKERGVRPEDLVSPQQIANLVRIEREELNDLLARTVLRDMIDTGLEPLEIVRRRRLKVIEDDGILTAEVERSLLAAPELSARLLDGDLSLVNVFVGRVNTALKLKADTARVRAIIENLVAISTSSSDAQN